MMRSLILLICLFTCTCGQGYYNFRNMAVILNNINNRLSELKTYLEVEEAKQLPTVANQTLETLNLTYSTLSYDIEMRLQGLENQMSLLEDDVKQCPNRQPPAPPRNIRVSTETIGNSSYASVYWDAPSPEPFALYYQYGVYFTPTNKTGHPTGNGAVFSICNREQDVLTITDLPPNKYFKINVASVVGPQYIGYGEEKIMKTLDLIPAAPSINFAETKGPNEIMILYERGPSDATVLYYVVYYKNGTGYEESRKIFAGRNYTLDDLTEGTNYTIAIAAASDNGVGEKSNEINIGTYPYVPPPPNSLNCSAVNSSALRLTWKQSPAGDGIVRYYEIVASIDGIVKKSFVSSDLTLTSTVMTDLQPAKQYYFVARSFTRRRKGADSVGFFCGTLAAPPDPPENIKSELIWKTPPRYRFTFRPPSKGQSEITGFNVTWGVKGQNGTDEAIDLNSLSWESDFTDEGLPYVFKFITINPVGISKPATVELTNEKARILTPPNIRVHHSKPTIGGKTRNRLTVNWTEPYDPVDKYQILYKPIPLPNMPPQRWTLVNLPDTSSMSYDVTLPENDERLYYFVVRAIPSPRTSFVNNQWSPNRGRGPSPPGFNQNNNRQNIQNTNNPSRNSNPSSIPNFRNTRNNNPNVVNNRNTNNNMDVNPNMNRNNVNPNVNPNNFPNVNPNFNSNSNVNRNTNFNI